MEELKVTRKHEAQAMCVCVCVCVCCVLCVLCVGCYVCCVLVCVVCVVCVCLGLRLTEFGDAQSCSQLSRGLKLLLDSAAMSRMSEQAKIVCSVML